MKNYIVDLLRSIIVNCFLGYFSPEESADLCSKLIERESCVDFTSKDEILLFLRRELKTNKKDCELFSDILFHNSNNGNILTTKLYVNEVINFDEKKFTPYQWNILRIILESRGLFVLSHYVREKAKTSILNTKRIKYMVSRFLILIENNELKKANCELMSMKFRLLSFIPAVKDCYRLYEAFSFQDKSQDDYQNYIYDKDIALIGPSPKKIDISLNDNSAVVRFSYINEDCLSNCNSNIKTNISYYNYSTYVKLVKSNIIDRKNIDWICTKNDNIRDAINERTVHQCAYSIPFGSLNMVQVFLYDVIHYNFKSLFIYNVDFFISGHYDRYVNSSKADNDNTKTRLDSYCIHDAEGNYLFTKNLYDKGVFACDSFATEILNAGVLDYMYRMDEVFINSCKIQ